MAFETFHFPQITHPNDYPFYSGVGAKVALEVLPAGSPKPKTIVLVEKSNFEFQIRSSGLR